MQAPASRDTAILFVVNAQIVGGAESHTAAVARDLAARGLRTAVLALRRGTERPAGVYLNEPTEKEGFWRRRRRLLRFVEENQITHVVAVNQRPLAVAWFARLFSRKAFHLSVVFHTTELKSLKFELMQLFYTRLFNCAHMVFFVSENQRRHWLRRGMKPKDPRVILNGIDVDRFHPDRRAEFRAETRRRHRFADTDVVLGCVAALRSEKNHAQLLEAIARLRRDGLPIKGMIVGGGDLLETLQRRAADLGIADHVVFTGSRQDVRPYVAAFDLGVLPSTAVETLSLSALEIMGLGVPMVMSRIGGADEIVDDGCGRLFAKGDTDALCRAVKELLPDDVRAAAGRAARRVVEERFDARRMFDAYHAALTQP